VSPDNTQPATAKPGLVRYRAAVMKLSKELPRAVGPEVKAHIDDLWRSQVAPAVLEIEEALADHGVIREIARSATTDIRTLMAETAGLFLGMNTLSGLDAWVNATIAGAGPTIHAGARGALAAYDAKRDAKRHDLFFLYAVNRRLEPSRG
jgi:hypothetical protein